MPPRRAARRARSCARTPPRLVRAPAVAEPRDRSGPSRRPVCSNASPDRRRRSSRPGTSTPGRASPRERPLFPSARPIPRPRLRCRSLRLSAPRRARRWKRRRGAVLRSAGGPSKTSRHVRIQLPVSARLRGEHLERDGNTLAARSSGEVFAASGRIARRDSVDSRASTWAPDEDEDVEGTNAAGSRPSSREWEDEIEDGDERRNTASFLASPVAWSPASPAPRGRRRDA